MAGELFWGFDHSHLANRKGTEVAKTDDACVHFCSLHSGGDGDRQ